MNVCLDKHGDVIAGMTPFDPQCTTQRDITETDLVPYHLSKHLAEPASCKSRRLIRNNVLLKRSGVERAIGAVLIERETCSREKPPIPAYYSVRWVDDRFAFIMGAWSRGADGGKVGGAVTPVCQEDPWSSSRHFRNWVIAADDVKGDEVGYGVFTKRSSFDSLPPLGAACPTDYRSRYLALWTKGTFEFSSGARLEAILSHPYSQADKAGETPGHGAQMERTYWTRELGQSRWENWKRDDYVHRKSNMTAMELAEDSSDAHACSRPMEISGRVTPGMDIGPLEERDGIYSQVVRDLNSGERHRWIMTNCQDMTALVPPRDTGGDPYPSFEPVTSQFWDFWAE